jgi:hypothetical protein
VGVLDLLLVDRMDKPFGPRQPPPDKRHAAYESIFGRPGVSQHKQPVSQPYQGPEKRSYDTYAPYQPSYPSYPSSLLVPEHQPLARANSTSPYPPRAIHDHSLTPAQTYQAQVYMNGPNAFSNSSAPPADWPTTTPAPPERHPHRPIQNGRPFHPPDVKQGTGLEHDSNGSISGHEDRSLVVDRGESGSGSELPWARMEHTGIPLSALSLTVIHLPSILAQSRHSQHRSISEHISVCYCLYFF